jgi:GntR family transcriptional regulator / MocR family aminotransferase
MSTRAGAGPLLTLPLDARASVPLFRQLYDGVRRGILDGTLAPGLRLPATRQLASELGVSRNTVLNAYEQLLAEGYLQGRTGSGTYVPPTLPEELLQVRTAPNTTRSKPINRRALSRRGELLAHTSMTSHRPSWEARPFRPGIPALDAFPFETWTRLVTRHHRRPPCDLLSYDDPAGYAPLRKAIADYLGPARAVHCDPEQVLIVTGSQLGLDLIARLLLDSGDKAWMEDPGYPSARAVLQGAGVLLHPVPVDNDGLDVAAGCEACPDARLAYVTPSHQYPLGVTLSLARRLALLDWAQRAGAWIVEDDYDSEFRYAGRPLAALQGLDRDGRVIYLGTFSKVLFPSLRLGYLVAPPDLVDSFIAARAVTDRQSPTLMQAVVADFINEGHFVRHIRRMRTLYQDRQETLLRAAHREFGSLMETGPCETGLHLIGWLAEGHNDRVASRSAAQAGIEVPPLSNYRLERRDGSGLLLGYAGSDSRQIRDGIRRLAAALRRSEAKSTQGA